MTETFSGLALNAVDKMPSDYGRWLIHGPQGSGKTTLAASIAEFGKTLFIDLTGEKGILSIKGLPYGANIQIIRPTSVTELDDLFWELNKEGHDFKAVVVDSVTAMQKMTMRFLLGHDETAVREIVQGGKTAEMRTWGQSLDIMTDLATFWYGLADGQRSHPVHVVMTAQSKEDEDTETGTMAKWPDVQRGARSIMLAAPDYISYTDVEHNMEHLSDPSQPAVTHIVRFGADPQYRTKARIPYNLRGKIPPILGRRKPASLADLSRVLGIGGVPAQPQKATGGTTTEKKRS